jgi:hypothetical protein
MNLLSETLDALNNSGKTRSDVRWIGSSNYGYFDWEHFVKIGNVEYNMMMVMEQQKLQEI